VTFTPTIATFTAATLERAYITYDVLNFGPADLTFPANPTSYFNY